MSGSVQADGKECSEDAAHGDSEVEGGGHLEFFEDSGFVALAGHLDSFEAEVSDGGTATPW